MERLEEIEMRLSAIRTEMDAEGADIAALDTEADKLIAERTQIKSDIETRQALRAKIGNGTIKGEIMENITKNPIEERAAAFAAANREAISTEETRSLLVSTGHIATPTEVAPEINDIVGAKVSSILDLVNVENCEGMSSYRVSYEDAAVGAAGAQTEGSAAGTKEGTFNYVDIVPTSIAALSQISKQVKKQTPINYEAKVRNNALIALRKKAVELVVTELKASTLNGSVPATIASTKGVIDEKTLRTLALNYGGDEAVEGGCWLFLNKKDLLAFGDVRGSNEKKPVYEITPSTANGNIGTIKDGGLVVNYCIVSGLTPAAGTAQEANSGNDIDTMFYGNPKCFTLGLFSNYEIRVSDDFAFDKLMTTIVGDAEVGGKVTTKGGFISYRIAKKAA